MKKHISFTSIDQFKSVCMSISKRASYMGMDENGEAIIINGALKPVIKFTGTVKLHGCFSENTLVTLANGEQIEISKININDQVLSFDINSNKYVINKVLNTFKKDINIKWLKLYFDNDTFIECTEKHLFYTKNRGWIKSKDLLETDIFILNEDEFTLVPMKLIKIEKIENKTCYDIEVENTHCYFVNDILVHNSNAGVSFNETDGIWYQSKENIITATKDNAGFAFFADVRKDIFIEMIRTLAKENSIDLNVNTISIFGEWAGPGIQKGVGISMLPQKTMFVFSAKVSIPGNEDFVCYNLDCTKLKHEESFIFNINDFPTYEIEIDFNNPALSTNEIIEMTLSVENECPVAKQFGNDNTIGEGIVFKAYYKDVEYKFKSKGEKHSAASKVKILKPVDNEKINKLISLAQLVTQGWRLEQMYNLTFDIINGGVPNIKNLGIYIKNVISDIQKEESNVISENGFELNDISKYISDISKAYFFEKEKQFINV
jgi:hypothetical protein